MPRSSIPASNVSSALRLAFAALVASACDHAFVEDDVAAGARAPGSAVGLPQLDVRVAPLPLVNCAYAALEGRLAWTVPAGATAVVTQDPRTLMVLVNGVSCAPEGSGGMVKRLSLAVGADAELLFDHGVGGRVFLPGSGSARTRVESAPGVAIGAEGAYTLGVRGTARADVVTLGATGVSIGADAFREIAWNTRPSAITVATDAGNDVVSGLGGRGTGGALDVRLEVHGGAGQDNLGGGLAADLLDGGEGADSFTTAPEADGADVYLGGPGADRMSYANTAVTAMRVHDGRWHTALGDVPGDCAGRKPAGTTCDPATLDPLGRFGVLVTTGAVRGDDGLWRPVSTPLANPDVEAERCRLGSATRYDARLKREVKTRAWTRRAVATDGELLALGSGRIVDITDAGCAARFALAGGATGPGAAPGDPKALWCLESLVTEGDVFEGVEAVTGTAGKDVMQGGGCDAVSLFGAGGDDVLYPGLGNEGGQVNGGPGDDLLLLGLRSAGGANGATLFAGGGGADLALCPGCEAGLVVSFDGKANDGFRAASGLPVGYAAVTPCRVPGRQAGLDGDNVLDDVEAVQGGSGDDLLIGDNRTRLLGGGLHGVDVIYGGSGREYLFAGALAEGADLPLGALATPSRLGRGWAVLLGHFRGSTALTPTPAAWPTLPLNARAAGRSGKAILCGGRGHDTLLGASGRDWLFGGDQDDVLFGAGGDDVLSGGTGEDWLEGGEGDDLLSGGGGADLSFCTAESPDDAVIDTVDSVCVRRDDPSEVYVGEGWGRLAVQPALCNRAPRGTEDLTVALSGFPQFHGCAQAALPETAFHGPAAPADACADAPEGPGLSPGVGRPQCGDQPSTPRASPRDYAFWYWPGNHKPSEAPGISRLMHFLTGHYALTLDEETGDIGRFGVLDGPVSAEEALGTPVATIDALPAADLSLVAGLGETRVTATQFLGGNANTTARARLIDGGRVANRVDIPTVRYAADPTYTGAFEIVSQPRHVVFTHTVTSSAWQAGEAALARIVLSGDAVTSLTNVSWLVPERAVELVDEDGRGWVFIVHDAPDGDTRLDFADGVLEASRTRPLASGAQLSVSLLALRRDAVTADELALYLAPDATVDVAYTLLDQHGQPVSNHEVAWNERLGAFEVPLQSLQAAGGPNGANYDTNPAMHNWYGRHRLTFDPKGRAGLAVPLALFGSNRLAWYIVGGAFMFRDAAGEPIGVPIQISKNWHNFYWYHLYAQPTLVGSAPTTVELTVASSRWGETYAASHAQLSLVGWSDGATGHWDESAIGAFGESVTYDPDQTLGRAMVDDVRPLLVLAGQRWNWTGNVGGADFLRYSALASPTVRRRMARVRTLHVANGPNLTDVLYHGLSSDGRIEGRVRVQMGRTDDLVRVYYHLDYLFLQDVTYSRLAFFQMAADSYGDNTFTRYAYGDADGARVDAPVPNHGTTGYARTEDRGIPLAGESPWVGLYAATPRPDDTLKEHIARIGIVIRDFHADIGGVTLTTPHINLNRTWNGNLSQVAFELGLPYVDGAPWCGEACQGQTTFVPAGSRVRATLEYVVPPADKALYYGASDYLTAMPAQDFTTNAMMVALANGNRLEVETHVGQVRRVHPVEIDVAPGGLAASLTLTGGLGYVPMTFHGLARHDGWHLERREADLWVRVDQSVRGQDYWQARFAPETGRWSLTFNVPNTGPTDYRLVWVRP